VSDLGSLSSCMLESDAEARNRARRLRQKALVVSIVFEAALIGARLLWPLITPGVLTGRFIVTPAPPYHGGSDSVERHTASSAHSPVSATHSSAICLMCAPPAIPVGVRAVHDAADGTSLDNAPGIGVSGIDGPPGFGPVVPGGFNNGKPMIDIPKPSPPQRPAPLRMSEGVMEASLIHKVQPSYPAIARAIHLAGAVQLRAIIAADGSIRQVDVISGNALLVQSAIAAVREWRYRPTRLNGEAVEVETLITVNFVLDQQ
jgi:protein TonB